MDGRVYLPATRYTRVGSSITIEYEFIPDGFGPARPDFGSSTLLLGELAAGNYAVTARIYDLSKPGGSPATMSANIPVAPPADWGIYSVPREPMGYSASEVMIRSAAYFDPASMRATYRATSCGWTSSTRDSPANERTPGMSTFGPALSGPAPVHVLEGWGRKTTGGDAERYFTRAMRVGSAVPVVEYYSATLDHYFISAGADEIALVDRGGQGDWKRTSQAFLAWARASDAPPGAVGVCRFYARGPKRTSNRQHQ